tara:strand:- start:971 stop:2026 length:1056 start_codon:yes stop_codon:yes gene_type:complete
LYKNKQLQEAKNPTTDRYLLTQPKATGDITHAPLRIQNSRIEIGLNIDRFLQRPFVTVGEELMDDSGQMRKITNPKETNLLLYVYRGVSPDGKLMNQQNVAAVNKELIERVGHFLMGLDSLEKKILASDIDFIIQSMAEERSPEQKQTHQSTHMLKNAPGHFDDYVFATRRRSVYKDTRAGKDFMLKKTPELKNIPAQHHFLFSMENLMGRVKQALGQQPDTDVPALDAVSYDANYRLGDTTEEVEIERNYAAPESEVSVMKAHQNLFMMTYTNPPQWILNTSPEEQLQIMGPHFETILIKTKNKLETRQEPTEFFDLMRIEHNIPDIFLDEYEEVIESFLMGLEEQNYDI